MTMSDDLDELDAALRRAMAALDGEAPAGYFEALPGRTLARLDDPAFGAPLGTALGELPEEPGRPLRAVQDRRPPPEIDDEDDDAVFASQVMAAVELPEEAELAEPAPPGTPRRHDPASASSVLTVLPVPSRVDPAEEAAASRSPGAVPAPSSGGAVAPVEAPAGAAVSMTSAGSARHRRSRRTRAAIVGIGAIGLAAVAAIYLTAGDHAHRSAPSVVLQGERMAPDTAVEAASPGPGSGPAVSSVAAGSAASTGPGAGSTTAGSRPTASGGVAGSAATPPVGSGSGALQDHGARNVDKPVAKLPGPPGKRPGNVKSPSKGGSKDPESELPDGVVGKTAAGKKLKSTRPRPDRASLSGDDIERAMAAVAGQARACFAGAGGTASLRLTVAPSGRIAKVTVTGPHAGTAAGACLERAVQAATFPAWSGAPQSFDYSYPLSD